MPRQKLRPENESRNWVYVCKIVGEPPKIIFETAKAMNVLWNELTTMHERTPYRMLRSVEQLYLRLAKEKLNDSPQKTLLLARAAQIKAAAMEVKKASYQGFDPTSFHELRSQVKALKNEAKAAKEIGDSEQHKQLLFRANGLREESLSLPPMDIPFEERVKDYVQERGTELELPVWCKWYVGETFLNAMQAYAKGVRFAPVCKRGLDSIHIEQRTESGVGWAVSELFARRKPFSLRPETLHGGEYYGWDAQGWFSIHDQKIPIRLVMHRSFPDGAIVKRYSLLGHYEAAMRKWEWRLLFQLEMPPTNVAWPVTNRIVAIDAGWRIQRDRAIREDSIRVLTLYDGFSVKEFWVPFDLSNRLERRYDNKPRVDIREKWAIQSQRDNWLEECKAKIGAVADEQWPKIAKRLLVGLTKMKGQGLMRLRRLLSDAGITCEPIETWLAKDRPAWIRQRYIERRWIAARNELYRQFAAEIAESIDHAIWEGDLSLKNIAEQKAHRKERRNAKRQETGVWEERSTDERILEESQKWRTLASLSQLRLWIREAMAKRGKQIIDDLTAHSSQVCSRCGAEIDPSPKLFVECMDGHRWDQDVNTAKYYWNRFDEDLRAVAGPWISIKRSQVSRYIKAISP